ncbi:MAG: hypothetical protein HY367_01635, partial [Candidatus Aenigmarchaeota archaeon]|nr:hypothetical protein [Candidatus Aenigmarchaeota archaeon]
MRGFLVASFILVFILVAPSALAQDIVNNTAVEMTFNVVDKATGEPVTAAGICVYYYNKALLGCRDGGENTFLLEPGDYFVSVTSEGYNSVELQGFSIRETTGLRIALEKSTTGAYTCRDYTNEDNCRVKECTSTDGTITKSVDCPETEPTCREYRDDHGCYVKQCYDSSGGTVSKEVKCDSSGTGTCKTFTNEDGCYVKECTGADGAVTRSVSCPSSTGTCEEYRNADGCTVRECYDSSGTKVSRSITCPGATTCKAYVNEDRCYVKECYDPSGNVATRAVDCPSSTGTCEEYRNEQGCYVKVCKAENGTSTRSVDCSGGFACPDLYGPVCGADGKTYTNECFARAANARIAHDGPCEGTSEPSCRQVTDDKGYVHYLCPTSVACPVITDDFFERCKQAGGEPVVKEDENSCRTPYCDFGGKVVPFPRITPWKDHPVCPTPEHVDESLRKCTNAGLAAVVVVEGSCKLARCIEPGTGEPVCRSITAEQKDRVVAECTNRGLKAADGIDKNGCRFLRCAEDEHISEIPEEAYVRCREQGGEMVVRKDGQGRIVYAKCVLPGN